MPMQPLPFFLPMLSCHATPHCAERKAVTVMSQAAEPDENAVSSPAKGGSPVRANSGRTPLGRQLA